jgi:hypothetical protein
MAPPEEEDSPDRWDRFLDGLDRAAKWPTRPGTTARARFLVLLALLSVVAAGAIFVSNHAWRDSLPRSTIAAVGIGLSVLCALWLFGNRGSTTALSVLAALGAILVAAGAAVNWDHVLSPGPPPPGAVVDCPDLSSQASFTGTVAPTEIGYTHLRAEADLHSPVHFRYPPGCTLAFDAYCLGEAKDDWRFDTQDPVWLRTASHDGFVSSADLKAGPPGGNVPEINCPGETPEPGRPEITAPLAPALKGRVTFAAADPDAIQVGFALYYDEAPGHLKKSGWHQLGVDLDTGDGINASWDSRSVPGQSSHRPAAVTLMAVPCNGLEFPSQDHIERAYWVANRQIRHGRSAATAPTPEHGGSAARTLACANTDR